MDANTINKILTEIYDRGYLPFDSIVLETMQGVTLANIANRIDSMKGNQLSFYEYGGLTKMTEECERMTTSPVMSLYTVGITSLSYFEWRKKLKR